MTRWFRCGGCFHHCCTREDILVKYDFLDDVTDSIQNHICPYSWQMTDFRLFSDDDVGDAMTLMREME